MDFFEILLLIFTVIFAATAVVTILALIGKVPMAKQYKDTLFKILIAEVIASVFSTFSYFRDYNFFRVLKDVESPEIWDDFHGTYRAYNDSWLLESQNPNRYIPVHRKRFEDKNSKFQYMFYINPNDQPGKRYQSFERFVKFQAMVHFDVKKSIIDSKGEFRKWYDSARDTLQKVPSLSQIECCLIYTSELPSITYFVGTRDGLISSKNTSIIYLISKGIPGQTAPYQIIETNNNDLFNHLNYTWREELKEKDNVKIEAFEGKALFDKYFGLPII